MSTKTIAVLDDSELKDRQMKEVSFEDGKVLYLVLVIRYTQPVRFVPIMERLLSKVSCASTAESSGKCITIIKFKLQTYNFHQPMAWGLFRRLIWGHRHVAEWTALSYYPFP